MRELNVGLVGLGKMGILHGGILCSMDSVVPRAVADSETVLHKFAKSILPDMNFYKDYREMLEKEALDLVYITTPTALHPPIAEACVEKGVAFFVEKPLGLSCEQCVPLIRKIQQKPVTNMVGYVLHFQDVFRKAKAILDSGVLGRLIHLRSYMYVTQTLSSSSGAKHRKAALGGGVLNVLATHLVDVLLWFFGDIAQVQGSVKSYYSQEVEDFAHGYLRFKSGLEGYLDTSWSLRGYRLPEIRIEVEGERGKLIVTEDFVKLFSDGSGRWETHFKQSLYQGVEIDIGGPEFTREDRHMVESVLSGSPTGLDVIYAYGVQKVTDALYESARTGRAVEVGGTEVR